MLLRNLLYCALSLTVVSGAVAEERMSGESLKALFADSTQTGTTKRGSSGPLTYWLYKRADGTSVYKLEDGWSDTGSWHINDKGESCTSFEKIRKGKERCSAIFKVGDSEYKAVRPDGSTNQFKVVPGNTQNL